MTKIFVFCIALVCLVLPGVSTAGSLIDNYDGTVTDSGTHLMWQQGERGFMDWEAALTTCETSTLAGNTDWRLPNHKELLSLVDDTRVSPSINIVKFPDTMFGHYLSSTTNAGDTTYSIGVNFSYGLSMLCLKTNSFYVRCVRGGQ